MASKNTNPCILLPIDESRLGRTYTKVELTSEAAAVIRRLRMRTGLATTRLVSELIVQAEQFVRVEEEEVE